VALASLGSVPVTECCDGPRGPSALCDDQGGASFRPVSEPCLHERVAGGARRSAPSSVRAAQMRRTAVDVSRCFAVVNAGIVEDDCRCARDPQSGSRGGGCRSLSWAEGSGEVGWARVELDADSLCA
jgi:hypothetical protein